MTAPEEKILVRVRLFAHMARDAGESQFALEIPTNTRAGDIPECIRRRYPNVRWPKQTLIAVNQAYAPADTPLAAGDEIAIIPPVSGG